MVPAAEDGTRAIREFTVSAQLAAWVHISEEYVPYGISGFASSEPYVQYGRHVLLFPSQC